MRWWSSLNAPQKPPSGSSDLWDSDFMIGVGRSAIGTVVERSEHAGRWVNTSHFFTTANDPISALATDPEQAWTNHQDLAATVSTHAA